MATMQKSQWDTLQGPETESDIREWGRYTQDQERLQYDDEDGFIGTSGYMLENHAPVCRHSFLVFLSASLIPFASMTFMGGYFICRIHNVTCIPSGLADGH